MTVSREAGANTWSGAPFDLFDSAARDSGPVDSLHGMLDGPALICMGKLQVGLSLYALEILQLVKWLSSLSSDDLKKRLQRALQVP